MAIPALPKGYVAIPDGQFEDGVHTKHPVEAFNMKAAPVTNAEWNDLAQSYMGRYIGFQPVIRRAAS